jgi:L-asparaginase II
VTSLAEVTPVLAEVWRSGFLEGWHRGSVVVTDPDGSVRHALGRPDVPYLPRSANKPFTAVAVLDAGAEVTDRQLAVISASHVGDTEHVELVREVLGLAGLDESALGNPASLPGVESLAHQLLRHGGGPTTLHQNCSGHHAGMLLACAVQGWPLDDYLSRDHPVQKSILDVAQQLTGETGVGSCVDGCGAPLVGFSLIGLARAYSRLVTSRPGTAERRVADAMRTHPELVSGEDRDPTLLMRGVPGLLVKGGAEAVYVAALDDGTGIALKLDDGAARATIPVLVGALKLAGACAPVLDRLAEHPLVGGHGVVGGVRAVI